MNIKKLTLAAIAAATGAAIAAVPEVSNVTMTQAANRLVTITYTLTDAPAVVTLDIQTNANVSAAANDPGWTSIGGAAICNAQGDVWKQVSGKATYTITWQPDQTWTGTDGNGFKIAANGARARVTAWPLDNTPDYMVVDVSAAAQPNTQKYYPSVEFLPGGLLSNSDYRTTSVVMRKIMAKGVEWTMGSTADERARDSAREATHKVTLTNNYYIGVFPVTQTQWGLVATNSETTANFTIEAMMRPMENVCYNEIRNTANDTVANTTYDWPADPNPASFMGLLRTKTGIDFDLPSEAQWEFAARSGHGSGYWNDGTLIMNADSDSHLDLLGRYRYNGGGSDTTGTLAPAAGGTQIVGCYTPNGWGLYDICGNVSEWCLDWYEDDIGVREGMININPLSPAYALSGERGSYRVFRGGSWNAKAGLCRPAYRNRNKPSQRGVTYGFRLYCSAGLK